MTKWLSDDKANWNDRAALHEGSDFYRINELIGDPSAITQELSLDLPRFGDLTGRDVIHLQCHLGTDTVGFARKGARRVVGIDFSDESVDRARVIAEKCQVDIEYVQANVYDARQAVDGDFDLVYTSLGVLCWLPGIAGWARTVASLLNDGGRFFIRDDHPVFMTVGEDVSSGLKIEQPYFQQKTPLTWDDTGSYIERSEGEPAITHSVNHQWNHSLGEIISALIDAGLSIDLVEESDASAWCPWPELMVRTSDGRWRLKESPERMPFQFVIEAHKQICR